MVDTEHVDLFAEWLHEQELDQEDDLVQVSEG
jgi:hypothetical protein